MDDFPGLLAKDFGIKPQGKSAPMAPPRNPSSGSTNFSLGPNYGFRSDFTRSSSGNAKSASNSIFDDQDCDGLMFNDVYGGPPKYSSESRATTAQASSFDYDSLFKDPKPPVFDKPVYDDNLFDGLPGIKSSSATSAAKYDDVFAFSGSPPPPKHKSPNSSPFDDLLGNLGRKETETKAKSERVKVEKYAPLFDDLLPGFGGSSSPAPARSISEAGQPQKAASNSSKTGSNLMEDPFVVLESTSDPADSSSGLFTYPSEEISKLNGSGKSRVESSSGSGGVFDDIDPLDGLGKSVPPVSSEVNKRGKDRSPLRTASRPQTPASQEPSDEDYEHFTKKRVPSMDNFLESHQTVFDMPSMSTDFRSSVGRTTSPPPYSNVSSDETRSPVNTTSRSENFDTSDDVWLTVSEIPLFTQHTSAPPPSRPPPPRPPRVSKSEIGSFSSTNAKKKLNGSSSFPNSTQYSHSPRSAPAAARSSVTSQIDELEDFAMGRDRNNVEQAEVFPGDDFETNSVAVASAAAMKEAMDRAEAKFRLAKEMRDRENLNAARNKEAGQMDKDKRAMQDALDTEVREKQERLERERQQREREEEEREQRRRELEREREEEEREQRRRELEREREEKEREQRRLEKERERVRGMERERARQAVERATREARERAATEARARAERAAVEKAAAEARERAERAAVQRAQAEARERVAAEARERAERAAAEAREREAREREARERTAAAKVEAEARLRAERAAVERVAAEARERAAAEARERAERAAAEVREREAREREARERTAAAKVEAEARLRAERAAVERVAAEARERAAAEARERAAAEAREREAREREARERTAAAKVEAEARLRAERAAMERVAAEARERAAAEARERAAAEAREREAREREARERTAAAKVEAEARLRAERAAVERVAAEARERAAAAARANQQKNDNDLESFFSMGSRPSSAPMPRTNSSDPLFDEQNKGGPEVARRTSVGSSSSMRKASSTANIVDDLSSIFGAAASSSGEFQEVEGETEERRRARLERHQRTQERAAKALAEKNQRDLQMRRELAERHRIAETLDVEIKRWAAGKEGNLRALLSTLQYVLWPECGWQPVSLTDLITAAAVKKVYRKATLCIHPDKVQQKGANLQQKYVAEKVFDLLKEAWNKFNSEELF